MMNALRRMTGLFGRRNRNEADPWPLDKRLLSWSKVDHHTIGHAVNGVICTGISGSGKSTGPGEATTKSYMRADFGLVIHTVKPSDVETALRWCQETGRADDVVLFGPGHPAKLNFLDYTLKSGGAGNGLTDNVVSCLRNCAEIRDRASGGGGGGGGENKFFVVAEQQALRAAVDVEVAATGGVSVPCIHRLVTSAPTSTDEFHNERWRAESHCFDRLQKASRAARASGGKINGVFPSDLDNAGAFWCNEWPKMADRTRSSVLSSVTGTLDTLNRGYCKELLCTDTTFRPEELFEGKILIFTMSTLR
jgi:hypothetical protein